PDRFQQPPKLLPHRATRLELHQRHKHLLRPGNLEAVFELARETRTARRGFEAPGGGRRDAIGTRTNDDELVRNPLDMLAHPFAEPSATTNRDEPHPMPAVRERRDLLHLDQLWHERQAVRRNIEMGEHL